MTNVLLFHEIPSSPTSNNSSFPILMDLIGSLFLTVVLLTFSTCGTLGMFGRKTLSKSPSIQIPDFTKEFQCETFHGQLVCNGTNDLYKNVTSQFENDAKRLKSEISEVNGSISRSGDYFPCSAGMDPVCTLLETILVPTFLTNVDGQPRYIYQNRHAGVVQEIRLVACRKGSCGHQGYGKCYPNERRYLLLSVNPFKPNKVFPDIFAVPGCCMCGQQNPFPPSPPHPRPPGPGYGTIGPGIVNKPKPTGGKPEGPGQPYVPYDGSNGYEITFGRPNGYLGGSYGGNYGAGYGMGGGEYTEESGYGEDYNERSRFFNPYRGSRMFDDHRKTTTTS